MNSGSGGYYGNNHQLPAVHHPAYGGGIGSVAMANYYQQQVSGRNAIKIINWILFFFKMPNKFIAFME